MPPPRLDDVIRNTPPAPWLLEMHDHYTRTGAFRVGDILRVLGDPREGVDMGPETTARAFLGLP